MEVRTALREELGTDPLNQLHRDRGSTEPGAFCYFDRTDPADPRFQHIFRFRVFFDEDEKVLHIVRGTYWRNLRS